MEAPTGIPRRNGSGIAIGYGLARIPANGWLKQEGHAEGARCMNPSAGTPNLSSASDIARIGERFHDVPTWIQSPHREMWDKNLVTSNPHHVFTGTSMELLFPGIRFSTVPR